MSVVRKPACLLVLIALALAAAGPASAEPPAAFTLADLGAKDIVARACYDQAQIHFPLAEGRRIDQAVLRLRLAHGKDLLPQLSALTIGLNGEPAASLVLSPDNAKPGLTAVELPAGALRAGDNVLTFRFRLRLHDKGCGDADEPGLWAKVFADTAIELAGQEVPLSPDLGRFPAPFQTLSALPGNPQIAILLPPQPTPAELTAAARIAAALGQAAALCAAAWENPPVRALTLDQLGSAGAPLDHLIAIGAAGRNPLASAPGVSEQVSPYSPNRVLLAVSGADDASLLQAADMLATRSARPGLQGTHVDPAPVSAQQAPEPPTRATLADLGFADRVVRGIGAHDLYYPLDVPYDWKITSGASVEVRFGHARGLAAASRMSAFVNGFRVADVALANRNAADGLLTVQLSPRQVHPGRNWLHLVFDLRVPSQDCRLRYLDEAWAQVSAASVANLPHVVSQPPLDLHYLPSPLVTPADLSADLFVLPPRPTPAELAAMVWLAAKLGAYSNADGLRPRATTSDSFAAAAAAQAHVIAIGRPETNGLLAEYDARLPQPLGRTNGALEPAGGRELLPEEAAGAAGYVELLPAPWSRAAALIVVSAPGEEELLRVVKALPAKGHRLNSRGNVAVVTAGAVKGLQIGELADPPLSAPARRALSLLLLGTFAGIGGVGLVSAQRRRAKGQESEDADD